MPEVEIWKKINVFNERYEVSNIGRIHSTNYRNTGKTKILSPVDKDGYKIIRLNDLNGNRKTYSIHQLVARAFILNPDK